MAWHPAYFFLNRPQTRRILKPMAHEYSNGEITILWEPDKCIHSAKCVRGLPTVFDPQRRPWIIPTNASTEELIAQVDKCPSGALTWRRNAEP